MIQHNEKREITVVGALVQWKMSLKDVCISRRK